MTCVGCPPPLAESCSEATPAAESLVQIGPASGSFHPFAPGERVGIEWGAQGLPMIGYVLRVEDVATPSCVEVTSRLSMQGGSPTTTTRSLRLRCGQSLKVLEVLPEFPCQPRDYALRLEVTVQGAGTASADLVVMGGGCPRGS